MSERPKGSDFMLLGYGVREMQDILDVWDDLSAEERARLGFGADCKEAKLARVRSMMKPPNLRVVSD